MPIDRDRQRARRRYARRDAKQAARAASRRRRQQIVGAVVILVLLVAGIYGLSRMFAKAQSGGASSANALASAASVHGNRAFITYGDLRSSADTGSRRANGIVTKGSDIRTHIPQRGTGQGTAADHLSPETSTVTLR